MDYSRTFHRLLMGRCDLVLHMNKNLKIPDEARMVKPSDDCPYCRQGTLEPSPSDRYLVCRSCGRIVVVRADGECQTR
jgi:hypothetical protein